MFLKQMVCFDVMLPVGEWCVSRLSGRLLITVLDVLARLDGSNA